MSQMIEWSPNNAPAVLDHVCLQVRQGRLVGLPTEAGYEVVASAVDSSAVAALTQLGDPSNIKPIALTLGDPQEVFDWLPHLRGPAFRLARSFWPGPFTLVAPAAVRSLLWKLPAEVVGVLAPDRRLAIRIPDHPSWSALGRRLPGPLVSASLPGFPREPAQLDAWGERMALVVNDGVSALAEPPTLIEVAGKSASILRNGAVPRHDVEEVLPCRILFVCTGNTCRSPLAEVLCRQLLSANLRCAPGELTAHGYVVQSAGLAAGPGNPATASAAAIARAHGAALDEHRSRPLSLDLLSRADFVFTMTESQRATLQGLGLSWARPQLLDPGGDDIDDPIGGSDEVYAACARQLERCLKHRLPELLES